MNLQELIQTAGEGAEETLHAQILKLKEEQTKNGKPFFTVELADATAKTSLKIWSDVPAFDFFKDATGNEAIELFGRFRVNQYGLNVDQPEARLLDEEEAKLLFAGTPEQAEVLETHWQYLQETFDKAEDERIRLVALTALRKYEDKWRRAAAARTYHHARRGGLLEHTAQMLRCAQAIAPLYPEMYPDLLYAGVLFHDIGKLWENDFEEQGFNSPPTVLGELIGHISIGMEVVNRIWHDVRAEHPEVFEPADSELLREHLLHLIVSHHGALEFGAPVAPRTPEAWALHQIDNLDAKIEMLRCAYKEKGQVVPGIFEPRRPLSGAPIAPFTASRKG